MAVTTKGTAVVSFPSNTQIHVVREFNAPADLVFRAYTESDLVKRWWHANRGVMTIADIDLRPGGAWRWVSTTPQGIEVAFHGEYREVDRPRRLVFTEIYEIPGVGDSEPTLNTLTFEDLGGRTRLISLADCSTQEIRDLIVESGMEGGLQDAYDLLELVATSLR
jgi:uncharacterized protein YndB with AHSA1/START domain